MQVDRNMKQKLLSDKFIAMLNARGEDELNAEAMYRQMANIAQERGLFGFQEFCTKQANEEAEHYQGVVNLLNDYGVCFEYKLRPLNISDEMGLGELLLLAFQTEHDLYMNYQALADNCVNTDAKEYGIFNFAIHKVDEQRKSVGEWGDIIARYELNGDIYGFDNYLKSL